MTAGYGSRIEIEAEWTIADVIEAERHRIASMAVQEAMQKAQEQDAGR